MSGEVLSRAMGDIRLGYIMEAEEYLVCRPAGKGKLLRTLLIAAVIVCFMTVTAFAVSAFSSLSGDSLALSALYQGEGVIKLSIENRSNRDLKLEESLKLYYYKDGSDVPALGGAVLFDGSLVPAGESCEITVDISAAYDVSMLEELLRNDFYCLQITNRSFLPGQRWSCIVNFRPGAEPYVPSNRETGEHARPALVEEQLSWYYDSFTDDIFQRWTDADEYFELVEQLIAQSGRTVAAPVEPYLLPDMYDWLLALNYSCFDGYNKIVGRQMSDHALICSVYVPCADGEGNIKTGGTSIPLFFIFAYERGQTQSPESCAFIRGCLLSFEDMEKYKIYEDESYVLYEMSPLFYTELRPYVQDMLLQRSDIYMDEQIWQRIERCHEHFSQRNVWAEIIYYHPDEARPRNTLSLEDIISISQKPGKLSYMDFADFYARLDGEYEPAFHYEMEGDFELVYSMHPNGEPKDFCLYHLPGGESVDIEREDVESFISEHS